MGLTGSAIGVVLAAGALAWLRPAVAAAAGVEAAAGLTASAVAQGAGIGLLVALLFALVPLLDVRHVRPSLLLRASEPPRPRRDGRVVRHDARRRGRAGGDGRVAGRVVAVGLILAAGFAGVSAGAAGRGHGCSCGRCAPLQRSHRFAVRYAVAPGRTAREPGSAGAAGRGTWGLPRGRRARAAGGPAAGEFAVSMRPDSPDMFLIDVQPDQADGVRAFLARARRAGRGRRCIPVLRARITASAGRETDA